MSKICLTLAENSIRELNRKISTYLNSVPLIEIRLDYLDAITVPQLPQSTQTEFIATCRPLREGGLFSRPESERLEVLQKAADSGFDWIDLEHDVRHLVKFPEGLRLIRSLHRFDKLPARFSRIFKQLQELPGDLVKTAVTPLNLKDLGELAYWMEGTPASGPRVVLGMGKTGVVTRILARELGNEWTYVSEGTTGQVAPGQFSLKQAREVFQVEEKKRFSLVSLVGLEDWIWDLTVWLNRLFKAGGRDLLCLPIIGPDHQSWIEYMRDSRLPFLGMIRFRPYESRKLEINAWNRETGDQDATNLPCGPDSNPLSRPILVSLLEQVMKWTTLEFEVDDAVRDWEAMNG
jgi:3-dehydroquinate dehydratase type I